MKILLDECVPWPMNRLLRDHACTSVQAQGWSGIRNGDLLKRAETEFDLFITSDQNIRYQQNLADRRIAILELSTNDLRRIQVASALIEDAVGKIQPNEFEHLTIPRGESNWIDSAVARSAGKQNVFMTCSWGLRPRLYAIACSAG